jgi:hypothetical protein
MSMGFTPVMKRARLTLLGSATAEAKRGQQNARIRQLEIGWPVFRPAVAMQIGKRPAEFGPVFW